MKKVDQNLVLESVASGAKQVRVEDHRCLPNNFTDFSAIVMLASNTKFEKVKPWDNKKKHNELDKDGSEDREVSSLEWCHPSTHPSFFQQPQQPQTMPKRRRSTVWRRDGGRDSRTCGSFDALATTDGGGGSSSSSSSSIFINVTQQSTNFNHGHRQVKVNRTLKINLVLFSSIATSTAQR